jgi:predicted MFS family arabinose efflux permease
VQLTAAPDFRGRAISHYTQCFLGMTPWGALLFGALATHIGVSRTLAIGGATVAAAGLIVFVLRRARYPLGTTLEEARFV